MNNYLENLNEEQKLPVLHKDGPLIVIAGAGSGKTRVLTYRIIHLITSESVSRSIWMGTFHSIFARILRSEAPLIGYPTNFTIYDTYDSEKLISNIIKEKKLDKDTYKAKSIKNRISSLKNNFITVENYFNNSELIEVDKAAKRDLFGEIYQKKMNNIFAA